MGVKNKYLYFSYSSGAYFGDVSCKVVFAHTAHAQLVPAEMGFM